MPVNEEIEIVSCVPNDRNAIVVLTEDVSMRLVAADGPVHHLEMTSMHVEVEMVVVEDRVARTSVTIVVEAK